MKGDVMGFIAKGFEPDMKHVKSRLLHCFRFEHLSPEKGITILIGIEPDVAYINAVSNWSNNDDALRLLGTGIPLLNGDVVGGFMASEKGEPSFYDIYPEDAYDGFLEDAMDSFIPFVLRYSNLLQYWNSGKHPDCTPPLYFIEWALSKDFRPEWLDHAIELGLYKPKQKTIANKIAPTDNAERYSTKWLEIQQATIAHFFNPRRNPDAKKEEVIEWINTQAANAGLGKSNNIASTIFTIIKPENHDPKNERVEPQQAQ